MFNEKSKAVDSAVAQVISGRDSTETVKAGGVFEVKCFDAEGNLKWEAKEHNLVVNQGLQDMNAKYFTGSAYTATWFLGLYGSGATNNPVAGDTAASRSFTEVTAYTQSVRPTCTFGTPTTNDPSQATNSASPAIFTINATTVVGGAFLISNSTKGGTTGILFSAADFAAPGDRSVVSGDTITVTYTFNLDAL